MRKVLILSLLVSINVFGQSVVIEEEKIKKTILNETKAYINKDMDLWRSCLTQSPTMTYVYGLPDGSTGTVKGYGNIEAMMLNFIEENNESSYKTEGRSDWNIKISGNVAWGTYMEKSIIDGKELTAQEVRVLEKINNEWKLDLISFIY